MSLEQETQSLQSSMARYCRTGDWPGIGAISPERAAVYRDLIFNVIEGTLQRSYPLTHTLLEGEKWEAMVNAFFSGHDPSSPYLWRMAKELYEWARETHYGKTIDLPYLTELLYFEWIEIEIYMMPDREPEKFVRSGDVWDDTLILNPEHALNTFEYPVFRAKTEKLDQFKGRYYLITYRHPDTLKVHFHELSPLHALVIELLKREPMSGEEAFELAASHFKLADTDTLEEHGREFLTSMWEQKIILGTQP